MNIKLDEHGRLTLPIAIRNMLGIERECYIYMSGDGQRLYITKEQNFNLDEIIRKRLKNKQITQNERDFLLKLRQNI